MHYPLQAVYLTHLLNSISDAKILIKIIAIHVDFSIYHHYDHFS